MNTKASQMRFRNRAKETGQALVLVALLMVILLGMLGLAIDGGGMFLLWRDAQNAVDAAALQAAFAYCTNGEDLPSAQEAGYTATEMNGFDNSGATGGDNWVTVDRATAIVLPELLPSNVNRKSDIILVRIVAEKPSYFIQLIYGGPLKITVTALGVCNAGGDSFFEGFGVYAIGNCGSDPKPEVDMQGSRSHFWANIGANGDIDVSGGGGGVNGAVFHDNDGDQTGVEYSETFGDTAKIRTGTGGAASTIPGATTPEETKPYSDYPVLYTWEEFEPGGASWNAVDMMNGVSGDYLSDDNLHYIRHTGNNAYKLQGEVEGLWVVEVNDGTNGGVSTASGFSIGPRGLTLVTNGTIDVSGAGNNKNSANLWQPFTSSTVTNSLMFFSTYTDQAGVRPPTSCTGGGGNAAVSLSGSGIIGKGIVYAPYGSIDYKGSQNYWCGSLIGYRFDTSNADKFFFSEEMPSETDLRAAGAEDWFFETGYLEEGDNCDFFPESQSEVFLGDLSS